MTTDILTAARQCLGTPFRHQGRQVGVGLDCAGVAIHVARAIGVAHLDVSGYGRTPAHGQLEQALEDQPCLERVPSPYDRQPGDLLLMRFARDPQHLAICAGETMIHGWESVGRCVEHPLDATWRRRIVAVAEFVDADDGADADGLVDSDASDDGGPSAGART